MSNGISRKFRKNQALSPDYIQLDERTTSDMIASALHLSELINFFNENNTLEGNWKSFLLADPLFIMAKISTTEIKDIKKENDDLSDRFKNSKSDFDLNPAISKYSDNFSELIGIVKEWSDLIWSDLLNKSDLIKTLRNEVSDLKKSIGQSLTTLIESNRGNKSDDLNSFLIDKIRNYSFEYDSSDGYENSYQDSEVTVFETFNSIYAKTVFFKDKVSKKFVEDINSSRNHQPHIGLLLTFYKLFELVRQDVNLLTKKHLDFYYRELLQQKQNNKEIRHTARAACILNKSIENFIIPKGTPFDFDMGDGKKIIFYAEENTQINQAMIADVKTIFKSEIEPFDSKYKNEAFKYNMLFESDLLQSLEAKNGKQVESYSDFPLTFGGEDNSQCNIGFVISSPILMLEKGFQEISIELKLDHDLFRNKNSSYNILLEEEFLFNHKGEKNHNHDEEKEKLKERIEFNFFKEAFDIYITTQDGWQLVDFPKPKPKYSEKERIVKIPLEIRELHMISFDPLIHEGNYDTDWPCIKILVNNYATYHPYIFLKEWEIDYVKIEAKVSEVTNLNLSNANGNIDQTIPFSPFGSIPEIGSFLRIQNPLILHRYLSSLEISINWNGLPLISGGFEKYYEAYQKGIKNESFKAFICQTRNLSRDASNFKHIEFGLFELDKGYLKNDKNIQVDLNDFELSNGIVGSNASSNEKQESLYIFLKRPVLFCFGHSIFSEVYSKAAMHNGRFFKKPVPLPPQPYTPIIDQLKVVYVNTTKENMLRKQEDKDTSIKLFHIYPFGHVKVFPGSVKSPCHLMPQIDPKGSLFIGLQKVFSNDIISVGFELLEAVLPHTVLELPQITWDYLYNNEWYPLTNKILEDGTKGLSRSGIVTIKLPESIQLNHTRLPNSKFWIRASYGSKKSEKEEDNKSKKENKSKIEDINSRIRKVFIQAIALSSKETILDFVSAEKYENKLLKISAVGLNRIEKIIGPMYLELNENIEEDSAYYNRVSELLRHKNRGVTNWDLERIILEKFEKVEKIRVYGRNNYPNELVKGSNVQIVVIPKNSIINKTSFQPTKISRDILEEIKVYAKKYMSPFARVEVCNPVFEKLKVRCRVEFSDQQRNSFLRNKLNDELVHFLSPNFKDFDSENLFEKSFTKTEIYNFIESRPYVKKVGQFSVIQLVNVEEKHRIIDSEDGKDTNNGNSENTRSNFRTISGYALLTSVDKHHIEIETSDENKIVGIGKIAIGTDFIVADDKGNYIDD